MSNNDDETAVLNYDCKKYIRNNGLDPNIPYEKLVPMVYSDSHLGIALEYLGYINKNTSYARYVSSRGGSIFFDAYEDGSCSMISMRELLDILPD